MRWLCAIDAVPYRETRDVSPTHTPLTPTLHGELFSVCFCF